MASLQNSILDTPISQEVFIAEIIKLHATMSKLEPLKPSEEVNSLFIYLADLCTHVPDLDIKSLPEEVLIVRDNLIKLCGKAEALVELNFASMLIKLPEPLKNLHIYPRYKNYVNLVKSEYDLLMHNGIMQLKKVAFVGSGPLPLTSIIMATHHMKLAHIDNYDIDETANNVASQIVATDPQLEKRMKFITCNVIELGRELREYDCIFLAALVGMKKEDKIHIIEHVRKHMKDGGILSLRSAKGSRAFLYHVVEKEDLKGFEILSTHHPTIDVVNSTILARKVGV